MHLLKCLFQGFNNTYQKIYNSTTNPTCFKFLMFLQLSVVHTYKLVMQLYHTYPHRFWFWGQRWVYGRHNILPPGVYRQVRDPVQSTPKNTVTIVTDILWQVKRHSAKLSQWYTCTYNEGDWQWEEFHFLSKIIHLRGQGE